MPGVRPTNRPQPLLRTELDPDGPVTTVARHRRTQLKQAQLGDGMISDLADDLTHGEGVEAPITNLVLHGMSFRSATPLAPGSIRHLRAGKGGEAHLASGIRVVSCRLRPDGLFDIGAEFF